MTFVFCSLVSSCHFGKAGEVKSGILPEIEIVLIVKSALSEINSLVEITEDTAIRRQGQKEKKNHKTD